MTVSTTTRLGVTTWTSGADPFSRLQMHESHTALEAKAAGFEQGTTLPTAAVSYTGFFFFERDTDTLSYCDGTAWFPAVQFGAPAALAGDAVVVAGSSALSARSDHVHAMPGFATPGATGTAAAEGSATSLARSDHVHTVGTNSVTTAAIADNQVTLAKMADDSVDSAEIVDGAIDSGHLANNSVTTDAIADSQVTNAKMADNAIDTVEIVDGAVTTAKITDGQVTLAKMADDSVDSAEIVDGAIDPDHLATGAVTTNKIGNFQVTNDKIADTTIATGKLNFTPVTSVAAGAGIAVNSSTASAPSLAMNVSGLTTVTVAAGDMVAIQDVTDDTTKKVTASSIAALAEQGTVTSITQGAGLGTGTITTAGTLDVQDLTLAQFNAATIHTEADAATWVSNDSLLPTTGAVSARLTSVLSSYVTSITLTNGYTTTATMESTGTAAVGSTVTVAADVDSTASRYITFVDSASGDKAVKVDSALRYKPSTDTLTAGTFSGNATSATKWQNTVTITLGGDLSGSVVFDGSSTPRTLTATVNNDSHTHDGRYYSETESNSRFAQLATANTFTSTISAPTISGTSTISAPVITGTVSISAPAITGTSTISAPTITGTTNLVSTGNVSISSGAGNFVHHGPATGTGSDAEWGWVPPEYGGFWLLQRNSSNRADKENETASLGGFTTDLVDDLPVLKYNRKTTPDVDEIGLIAEDADAVSSLLTTQGPDGVAGINKTGWMSLLTLAIQDIRTRLVALEA